MATIKPETEEGKRWAGESLLRRPGRMSSHGDRGTSDDSLDETLCVGASAGARAALGSRAKADNLGTAGTFARRISESEPTREWLSKHY